MQKPVARAAHNPLRFREDLKSPHRLLDVLDAARAGVDVTSRDLEVHLVVDRARDQHAARLCKRLQPRGDVDRVAGYTVVAPDDVAEVDADAQAHPLAWRKPRVLIGDGSLDGLRALDGVHGAWELRHQAVADAAEDAAVELAHERVEEGAPDRERGERAGLVGGHQPAVIDHVGREDGGNLAAVPDHGRLADRRGSIAPPRGRAGSSGEAALDLHDVRHAADGADQPREVGAVADLDFEQDGRMVALRRVHVDVTDVALFGGDAGRDLGEDAHAVYHLDQEARAEEVLRRLVLLPDRRNPLVLLLAERRDVRAVVAMDDDAAAAREVGDDRVVGYREAAARVADDETLGARDGERLRGHGIRAGVVVRQQAARDEAGKALAESNLLAQFLAVLQRERACDFVEAAGGQLLERQLEFLERLVQHAPAELGGLAALQVLEVLADRGACLRRHHEARPGGVRLRSLGGDDLHGLAVAQHRAQRHEAAVDLGGDAALADAGVHRVGEVHAARAARQAHDVTLRREHVDLVGEQVDLDALDELLGRALVQVHDVLQPLPRASLLRLAFLLPGLVLPVRGDAGLRQAVHVLGPDLHLDRRAVRAEQGGVQRLVAVHARDRDVVLETPGHRTVEAVHEAERAVALVDAAHDDADAEHVDDLRQRQVLAPHLHVDAVQVLLARLDTAVDTAAGERLAHRLHDLRQELALVAARALELALDDAVALGIERVKAELLELELDGVDAEAVGDRPVDVESLARHRAPLLGRHRRERAHVVRAVGELDHDDADVAHHRQHHLAEALGLRFLAALELDLVELGHAVDDLGDFLAELLLDLGHRGGRVLDHVVQDGGGDGGAVEVQVGEDVGDRDRVGDEGLAGLALLALVRSLRVLESLAHPLDLVGREVGLDLGRELTDPGSASSARQQSEDGRRVIHPGGRFAV